MYWRKKLISNFSDYAIYFRVNINSPTITTIRTQTVTPVHDDMKHYRENAFPVSDCICWEKEAYLYLSLVLIQSSFPL